MYGIDYHFIARGKRKMEEFDIKKELPVLDDDEEIIKTYKPNKKRFVSLTLVFSCAISAIFVSIFLLVGILGVTGVITFTDENTGKVDMTAPVIFIVISGIILLILLSNIFLYRISYKKAFYALTNKRVLIRYGIIGADYKSLEYRNIDTINVKVNFLDKLVRPNTGTISFGSASSPIINTTENTQEAIKRGYNFAAIENPYEIYKEIKQIVHEHTVK